MLRSLYLIGEGDGIDRVIQSLKNAKNENSQIA